MVYQNEFFNQRDRYRPVMDQYFKKVINDSLNNKIIWNGIIPAHSSIKINFCVTVDLNGSGVNQTMRLRVTTSENNVTAMAARIPSKHADL